MIQSQQLNNRKKSVFLFGAGATFPWGSPSTWDLTELILDSGFFIRTEERKRITRFIYDILIECGYPKSQVNFETIINVIEELIIYYSNFNYLDSNRNGKLPSLMRCFTLPKFEAALLNFGTSDKRKGDHAFTLEIPEGKPYNYTHYAFHGETPEQFYFQHLLTDLLTTINDRISKYAYHTPGSTSIKFEEQCSILFTDWMKSLADKNKLRLYTLNYERIFKVLLNRAGIEVFEGFDCGEFIDYSAQLRANVPKILADDISNVHYNLHGSAFWRVLNLDIHQLPNAEVVLTSFPHLPINDSPTSFQVEKGKTITVTNIVTGYQKAQRSMITPYKQMQFAFDRDCCFADKIYIIGYSFGDEHINECIKTAFRFNKDLKIVIIDPGFTKNGLDFQTAIKIFPYKEGNFFPAESISSKKHNYFQGSVTAYTVTFLEFLQMQKEERDNLFAKSSQE